MKGSESYNTPAPWLLKARVLAGARNTLTGPGNMYGAHQANHYNHERCKRSTSVQQLDVCFRSIFDVTATNVGKKGTRTKCKAEKNYVDGAAQNGFHNP